MEFRDKITLVIPTYNRYDQLFRLLKYYESFDFPVNIIVLNSSVHKGKPNKLEKLLNNRSINYIEYPDDTDVICKIIDGLKTAQTPYAVICADDDFITPTGILSCINFLDLNQDYSCAIGKSILFTKSECTNTISWQWAYTDAESVEDSNSTIRFYKHFTNYKVPTFYALTRTNVLLDILKKAALYTNDSRFGELLPSLLTIINGKMKVLEVLYSIREFNISSEGHNNKTIFDFVEDEDFEAKYYLFRRCLYEALKSNDKNSLKTGLKIIDRAMGKYLGSSLMNIRIKFAIKKLLRKLFILELCICIYHKLKLKAKESQQVPLIQQIEWETPETPDYQDINRVKEAIENCTIINEFTR